MFLTNQKMKVVVEGKQSDEVTVSSGVPKGTVREPLLFLCHINDIPDAAKSSVGPIAYDYLLDRQIKTTKDHEILQEDLKPIEACDNDRGMRFNAKTKIMKIYIFSINKKNCIA